MNDNGKLAFRIAIAALATGVLGDWLLRAAPWGLNLSLLAFSLIVASLVLAALHHVELTAEGRWLIGTSAIFASFFLWRAAPGLLVLDFLAAAGAFTLATLGSDGLRIRRVGIHQLFVAGCLMVLDVARTFPQLAVKGARYPLPGEALTRRHLRAATIGFTLSVPLVLTFGGLLIGADAVFEGMVMQAFDFDLDLWISHLIGIGFLAWLVSGLLRRMLLPGEEKVIELLRRPSSVSLGAIELGVPLGLLNALFLVFVVVQLRYLFGDASLVEMTTGLTYSEYARRGFFELVAVAALVIPLLLTADWAVERSDPSARLTVRLLSVLLIVLLSVIMASALKRMLLYVDAYGLTLLRLYATAFMGALALMLAWFSLTVLRNRRELFAGGAALVGLHVILLLNLMNPDALIVRVNVARAQAGEGFDAAYAAQLSADAVPRLLSSLDRLSAAERCRTAETLLTRWDHDHEHDWRSWNAARVRADREVKRWRPTLEAFSCPEPPAEVAPSTPTEPSDQSASESPRRSPRAHPPG